jgi:hypothetical protein
MSACIREQNLDSTGPCMSVPAPLLALTLVNRVAQATPGGAGVVHSPLYALGTTAWPAVFGPPGHTGKALENPLQRCNVLS